MLIIQRRAIGDWLAVRPAGRGLSKNTLMAYRPDIATIAGQLAGPQTDDDQRPAGERVTVEQLTPDAIVTAFADIHRDGAAPASRARIHGTLAGLCAHLIRQGHLTVDPLTA